MRFFQSLEFAIPQERGRKKEVAPTVLMGRGLVAAVVRVVVEGRVVAVGPTGADRVVAVDSLVSRGIAC